LPHLQNWAKWAISICLLALIILSWSRYLDDAAQAATLSHFKRALAVAAIARGFNGVISVAQGTEVAVQPLGIGVTLTIGEILDPLNDLIERFSGLALIASVSLGVQLTVGQMVTSAWMSGLMSVAVLAYLILLWRVPKPASTAKPSNVVHSWIPRLLGLLVFIRFFTAVMLLTTHFIDTAFLATKQDQAVATLSSASASIEHFQTEQQNQPQTDLRAPGGVQEDADFLERTAAQIGSFLDASSQTLDLKAQLEEVEAQVENSVEEVINLIVIFMLQTLLLPIASLWLCWRALHAFWRWNKPV
jgi:hypothetical protein